MAQFNLPQNCRHLRRYTNDVGAEGRLEQQSDGLYARYLPAQLLQEMNIVDTPGEAIVPCAFRRRIYICVPHLWMLLASGTNVILERQQRLTEEYVPRADLVLFVMSADRPFSDSEVCGSVGSVGSVGSLGFKNRFGGSGSGGLSIEIKFWGI